MQLYNTKVVPSSEDSLWALPYELPAFKNTKLLIVSAPFAAGTEEQTLRNMMTACRLADDEYAMIHLMPEERISWQMLASAGAPHRVLMLGVVPAQLAIHALFRLNHCNDFLGCTFIVSFSLTQIEQDRNVKRELWEQGLKRCFGL